MSKKKSYMNYKNIIDEGILGSIVKAITGGKVNKASRDPKKVKKLKSDIDEFNKSIESLSKGIEDLYGIQTEKPKPLKLSDLEGK